LARHDTAKALLPMRTLTERNTEPNAAGSSGPEFDEAESNVGITEATEFSAPIRTPSGAVHRSVDYD
jgi:hypothetical protein